MAKEEKKNKENNGKDKLPEKRNGISPQSFLSRFFDEDFWLEPFDSIKNFRLLPSRRLFPRIDITETENEIRVIADVPGVDPDNIEIDAEDNRLRIKGSITEEKTASDEKPFKYERFSGEFQREFALPAKVKQEEIKAHYKDGILTINLPKTEVKKKGRIKIEKE